ncbi:PAS domain S-box protein [Halobaculum sp. EA56]|uniref:PAS domain S-box protein n=1 Tax=Halobaculum sp. EA56 TaxID=3421648 RepID=UPI003EB719A0
MTEGGTEPLRVLLAVDERSDRRLLSAWLADAEGFEPADADPGAPFDGDVGADGDVDVCVLDVRGARAHGDALATARSRCATYLPTLLFVPERYGDPEAALADLGTAAEHVDDTVAAPVRRTTLDRRLRSLGRARRYSTELADSRDRFRRLVDNLPDPVFACEGTTVTYANTPAESLLGVPEGSLAGVELPELAVPADREEVTRALEAARADGRAGPVAVSLSRSSSVDVDGGADVGPREAAGPDPTAAADDAPDGPPDDDRAADPVPVEVTAVALGDGELQVIARDLRERRERERQLTLYRRAMDEATVGITISDQTDEEEGLVYANAEFERLTGRGADEILGRNPRFLQTDATDPDAVARLRRAIDAGEEASETVLNRRADGRMWYNALDISPIRGPDGEVTNYLGFQRDVTERVTRSQRLTVLDRVLRHNIRNRLNVVLGYAADIEEALPPAGDDDGDTDGVGVGGSDGAATADGEDGGIDAGRIRTAAERIRSAATDLLDLSDSARRFREDVVAASEGGTPVDAGTVVRDVTSAIAAAHPEAEVRFSAPERPVRVPGAAPLALVADELVSNAVRHVEGPTVTASLSVEDGDVVLRVADDGPGITPDSRAALGSGSETPTEHGQGIGLWLVRWTVDAVGGTVRYEDGPDGGAVVIARFPAVDRGGDEDGPGG